MIVIYFKIGDIGAESLNELIGGLNAFKALFGNGILNSGIVSVKCDHIIHTVVVAEISEHIGAVKRFSACAFMLPAFIEHGHKHGDPLGLAFYRAQSALEIGIVIVGAVALIDAVHFICNTVVEGIYQDKNIIASDGFLDNAFSLA